MPGSWSNFIWDGYGYFQVLQDEHGNFLEFMYQDGTRFVATDHQRQLAYQDVVQRYQRHISNRNAQNVSNPSYPVNHPSYPQGYGQTSGVPDYSLPGTGYGNSTGPADPISSLSNQFQDTRLTQRARTIQSSGDESEAKPEKQNLLSGKKLIAAGKIDQRNYGKVYKTMDPKEQRRAFKNGKVFMTIECMLQGSNKWGQSFTEQEIIAAETHLKRRRYIVFGHAEKQSYVVPIRTYRGQGTKPQKVKASVHAQAYSTNYLPPLLTGERRLTHDPIKVNLKSYSEQHLDPASRIDCSHVVTFQHNTPVLIIGEISTDDLLKLTAYVTSAMRLKTVLDDNQLSEEGEDSEDEDEDEEEEDGGRDKRVKYASIPPITYTQGSREYAEASSNSRRIAQEESTSEDSEDDEEEGAVERHEEVREKRPSRHRHSRRSRKREEDEAIQRRADDRDKRPAQLRHDRRSGGSRRK